MSRREKKNMKRLVKPAANVGVDTPTHIFISLLASDLLIILILTLYFEKN